MKKIILTLLFIYTSIAVEAADIRLQDYQQKYSLCHGKTDIQISQCLLNGNLNFSRLRGDRSAYRRISKNNIAQAAKDGDLYAYAMSRLPQTRRYIDLKNYIDHLYTIGDDYTPPKFKGNAAEDIINIKKVFNLLQFASLKENVDTTPEFVTELLKYQKNHGLEVNGKLDTATKRALKIPLSSIITKVKKNLVLESLSSPKSSQYILVNIPEFKMHYYQYHQPVLTMKVIVGKTKMRTPIFNKNMLYIVKNPKWIVPASIYYKEYAHKSQSYLRRRGFAYNSGGKLYQKEGKNNALGLVKFLFPNRYNVYMHDTPTKSLFNRRVRTFSHGCIRLEKALTLLNELGYEYDTNKNERITLKDPIPVYVEYHTVWIDDEGMVQFRDDIYGYERTLFN